MRKPLTVDDIMYEIQLRIHKIEQCKDSNFYKLPPAEYQFYIGKLNALNNILQWVQTRKEIGL